MIVPPGTGGCAVPLARGLRSGVPVTTEGVELAHGLHPQKTPSGRGAGVAPGGKRIGTRDIAALLERARVVRRWRPHFSENFPEFFQTASALAATLHLL